MTSAFVIGSRGSGLAMAQSELVVRDLSLGWPDVRFEILKIRTTGDIAKDAPLGDLNLKGAFTKELDEALLTRKIECAIHSLKDLPSEVPAGIVLGAVTKCLDVRDAWVGKKGLKFRDLPKGALVGTSSRRRTALILSKRPDIRVGLLRGNVDTRLKKLDRGEFDGIVLSAAGLKRLGLEDRITECLDPKEFIPAMGQGMLAATCREGDTRASEVLSTVDDKVSHQVAAGLRRFMARMEGGCEIPLGCFGEVHGERLTFLGFLARADGSKEIRKEVAGPLDEAESLGDELAEKILKDGGRKILKEFLDLNSGRR